MSFLNTNYSPSVQKQNNPSFGMALYMNEAEIAQKIGNYTADEAKKAIPALKKLAEDVDIFVQLNVDSKVHHNTLDVYVQDITPIVSKSKNPIKNFFNRLKEQYQIDSKSYVKGSVFPSDCNVSSDLVDKVKILKRKFLQGKIHQKREN